MHKSKRRKNLKYLYCFNSLWLRYKTLPITALVVRNFPYLKDLNLISCRIWESGLWINKFVYEEYPGWFEGNKSYFDSKVLASHHLRSQKILPRKSVCLSLTCLSFFIFGLLLCVWALSLFWGRDLWRKGRADNWQPMTWFPKNHDGWISQIDIHQLGIWFIMFHMPNFATAGAK